MSIIIAIVLVVLGSLFGSFACAQVWRLRARQLEVDRRDGEVVDESEYQLLKGLLRPVSRDRSECLYCHHQLTWYDLLPILGWILVGGKCRYCRKPIGVAELLAEVGLAAAFVLSFFYWPYKFLTVADVGLFSIWLIALVFMTILLIYDAKWSLLPFSLNISLIVVGAVFFCIASLQHGINIMSAGGGLLLLSGLYLLFSLFGWVGVGDGILGFGLALFLGKWELAFLTLFLANVLGCCMMIPLMAAKRIGRHARVPFGPFLIVATFIVMMWGNGVINWFFHTSSTSLIRLML